jgi:hypothetical protein
LTSLSAQTGEFDRTSKVTASDSGDALASSLAARVAQCFSPWPAAVAAALTLAIMSDRGAAGSKQRAMSSACSMRYDAWGDSTESEPNESMAFDNSTRSIALPLNAAWLANLERTTNMA